MKKADAEALSAELEVQAKQIKLKQDQQKLDSADLKMQVDAQLKSFDLRTREQSAKIDNLVKLIGGLKDYRTAIGADAIVTPQSIEGFDQQVALTSEAQQEI